MSSSSSSKTQVFPPQHQDQQPGIESQMNPLPVFDNPAYVGSGKLLGKVAVVTGGDSGIGRAVANLFAKEGADVVISYLNEHDDAEETKRRIESHDRKCLLFPGDIGQEKTCQQIVDETVKSFGKIDLLVNNAAEQHPKPRLEDITANQLERTFRTNLFACFYLTKAALPYMSEGSSIILTTSVTAYQGSENLLDYASTKGAQVAFIRSLSQNLVKRGIRVNGVAPGPIWTPLIPSTFPADQVATFGSDSPMKRAGQPVEVAPAYLYLASQDSVYMTGQVLHVNGGTVVNG